MVPQIMCTTAVSNANKPEAPVVATHGSWTVATRVCFTTRLAVRAMRRFHLAQFIILRGTRNLLLGILDVGN